MFFLKTIKTKKLSAVVLTYHIVHQTFVFKLSTAGVCGVRWRQPANGP